MTSWKLLMLLRADENVKNLSFSNFNYCLDTDERSQVLEQPSLEDKVNTTRRVFVGTEKIFQRVQHWGLSKWKLLAFWFWHCDEQNVKVQLSWVCIFIQLITGVKGHRTPLQLNMPQLYWHFELILKHCNTVILHRYVLETVPLCQEQSSSKSCRSSIPGRKRTQDR